MCNVAAGIIWENQFVVNVIATLISSFLELRRLCLDASNRLKEKMSGKRKKLDSLIPVDSSEVTTPKTSKKAKKSPSMSKNSHLVKKKRVSRPKSETCHTKKAINRRLKVIPDERLKILDELNIKDPEVLRNLLQCKNNIVGCSLFESQSATAVEAPIKGKIKSTNINAVEEASVDTQSRIRPKEKSLMGCSSEHDPMTQTSLSEIPGDEQNFRIPFEEPENPLTESLNSRAVENSEIANMTPKSFETKVPGNGTGKNEELHDVSEMEEDTKFREPHVGSNAVELFTATGGSNSTKRVRRRRSTKSSSDANSIGDCAVIKEGKKEMSPEESIFDTGGSDTEKTEDQDLAQVLRKKNAATGGSNSTKRVQRRRSTKSSSDANSIGDCAVIKKGKSEMSPEESIFDTGGSDTGKTKDQDLAQVLGKKNAIEMENLPVVARRSQESSLEHDSNSSVFQKLSKIPVKINANTMKSSGVENVIPKGRKKKRSDLLGSPKYESNSPNIEEPALKTSKVVSKNKFAAAHIPPKSRRSTSPRIKCDSPVKNSNLAIMFDKNETHFETSSLHPVEEPLENTSTSGNKKDLELVDVRAQSSDLGFCDSVSSYPTRETISLKTDMGKKLLSKKGTGKCDPLNRRKPRPSPYKRETQIAYDVFQHDKDSLKTVFTKRKYFDARVSLLEHNIKESYVVLTRLLPEDFDRWRRKDLFCSPGRQPSDQPQKKLPGENPCNIRTKEEYSPKLDFSGSFLEHDLKKPFSKIKKRSHSSATCSEKNLDKPAPKCVKKKRSVCEKVEKVKELASDKPFIKKKADGVFVLPSPSSAPSLKTSLSQSDNMSKAGPAHVSCESLSKTTSVEDKSFFSLPFHAQNSLSRFYGQQVNNDPLKNFQDEPEVLDFDPPGEDDEDIISIFADPTSLFGSMTVRAANEEEDKLTTKYASIGVSPPPSPSLSDRSLDDIAEDADNTDFQDNMDINENADNTDIQDNTDMNENAAVAQISALGIPVETYAPESMTKALDGTQVDDVSQTFSENYLTTSHSDKNNDCEFSCVEEKQSSEFSKVDIDTQTTIFDRVPLNEQLSEEDGAVDVKARADNLPEKMREVDIENSCEIAPLVLNHSGDTMAETSAEKNESLGAISSALLEDPEKAKYGSDMQVLLSDAEVHVSNAQVHVFDAQVHASDTQVHASDAQVHASEARVHISDVQMPSPDAEVEVSLSDVQGHAPDMQVDISNAQMHARNVQMDVPNPDGQDTVKEQSQQDSCKTESQMRGGRNSSEVPATYPNVKAGSRPQEEGKMETLSKNLKQEFNSKKIDARCSSAKAKRPEPSTNINNANMLTEKTRTAEHSLISTKPSSVQNNPNSFVNKRPSYAPGCRKDRTYYEDRQRRPFKPVGVNAHQPDKKVPLLPLPEHPPNQYFRAQASMDYPAHNVHISLKQSRPMKTGHSSVSCKVIVGENSNAYMDTRGSSDRADPSYSNPPHVKPLLSYNLPVTTMANSTNPHPSFDYNNTVPSQAQSFSCPPPPLGTLYETEHQSSSATLAPFGSCDALESAGRLYHQTPQTYGGGFDSRPTLYDRTSYGNMGSTDVDMRNIYPVTQETSVSALDNRDSETVDNLSEFCPSFLGMGHCVVANCHLRHECPDLLYPVPWDSATCLKLLRDPYNKYSFWIGQCLKEFMKIFSNESNIDCLKEMADYLWKQSEDYFKLENAGRPKDCFVPWLDLVVAICGCGVTPNDAVRIIFEQVLPKDFSSIVAEVADFILKQLYPNFISNSSQTWKMVSCLTKFQAYEIPFYVLKAVLDSCVKEKIKPINKEVGEYLLCRRYELRPDNNQDVEIKHQIHRLSNILSRTSDGEELAKNLDRVYFKERGDNCCDQISDTEQYFLLKHSGRLQQPPRETSSFSHNAVSLKDRTTTSPRLKNTDALLNRACGSRSSKQEKKDSPAKMVDITPTGQKPLTLSSDALPQSDVCMNSKIKSIRIKVTEVGRNIYSGPSIDYHNSVEKCPSSEPKNSGNVSSEKQHAKHQPKSLMNKDIRSLIKGRKFGVAASQIKMWRSDADILEGSTVVSDVLLSSSVDNIVTDFTTLHNAFVLPNMKAISTIGYHLVKGLYAAKHLLEAYNIALLVADSFESVSMKIPGVTTSSQLLLFIKTCAETRNFHKAAELLLSKRLLLHPEDWHLDYEEDDIPQRDILLQNVHKACTLKRELVLKTNDLFRQMMPGKYSYANLDVTSLLDSTLRALMRFDKFEVAANLLVWCDNNFKLSPKSEETSRALVLSLKHLPPREQAEMSPAVLLLLNRDPYKKAFPQQVAECSLPVADTDDFPKGLLQADPSLSAIKERIMYALQKSFVSFSVIPNKSCNIISLNQKEVEDFVHWWRKKNSADQIQNSLESPARTSLSEQNRRPQQGASTAGQPSRVASSSQQTSRRANLASSQQYVRQVGPSLERRPPVEQQAPAPSSSQQYARNPYASGQQGTGAYSDRTMRDRHLSSNYYSQNSSFNPRFDSPPAGHRQWQPNENPVPPLLRPHYFPRAHGPRYPYGFQTPVRQRFQAPNPPLGHAYNDPNPGWGPTNFERGDQDFRNRQNTFGRGANPDYLDRPYRQC